MKNLEVLEKTKKILVKKAKSEYYRGFWFLDLDESELRGFLDDIKQKKTLKELDRITFNLFHC